MFRHSRSLLLQTELSCQLFFVSQFGFFLSLLDEMGEEPLHNSLPNGFHIVSFVGQFSEVVCLGDLGGVLDECEIPRFIFCGAVCLDVALDIVLSQITGRSRHLGNGIQFSHCMYQPFCNKVCYAEMAMLKSNV